MKCSNPDCNRGIGLVAYQRDWFSNRRYCSKHCRDAFAVDAPNLLKRFVVSLVAFARADGTAHFHNGGSGGAACTSGRATLVGLRPEPRERERQRRGDAGPGQKPQQSGCIRNMHSDATLFS